MRPRRGQPTRSFLLGALAGASETRELGERAARKAREAIAGVAATLDRIAGR